MHYLEKPLSRREFMATMSISTMLLAGQSTLIGCDLYKKITDPEIDFRPNFPDLTEKAFPKEGGYVSKEDTEGKDRIFCASTVLLRREGGGYGHGSVVNANGEYHIYTIEHVIDVINEKSVLDIPGVGAAYIQPERIVKTKGIKQDVERAAYYILGPDLQAAIDNALEKGRISPLRQIYGLPAENEEVLIPSEEKGSYQRYKFVDFNARQNLMFLESANGEIGENCQGDSGSPILRITKDETGNELLTGEMYGVLQGSSKLYPVSERKHCATYFAARPNN